VVKKDYFESISFGNSKIFKVSRKMDDSYRDKLHWHPFVEILVCLTDRIRVTVNFTAYDMKTNDIIIVYPGDLHSVQEGPENSLLIIQFPYELLTVLNEIRSQETLFFRFPYIRYDPLRSDSDLMVTKIKQFAEIAHRDAPFQELRMYSHLLGFFEQVGQHCLHVQTVQAERNPNSEYKTTRQMAEACLFIAHNCTGPLTLDDVASHMGMSKSHFSHLFKAYTDMTFVDFLIIERVRRAKVLFENPSARIIDIAFDSGFSSISTFNRAFKKVTGQTPSEYRSSLTDPEKRKTAE
jgi:AraC-like DNA-binding protein